MSFAMRSWATRAASVVALAAAVVLSVPCSARAQRCRGDADCHLWQTCDAGRCRRSGAGEGREPVGQESRPLIGVLIAGSVTLGLGWLTNIATGSALWQIEPSVSSVFGGSLGMSTLEWWGLSYAPLAGPFIQCGLLAAAGADAGAIAYYAVLGGVQVVGLALIIVGASVRVEVPRYALGGEGGAWSLALGPLALPGGGGVSAMIRH